MNLISSFSSVLFLENDYDSRRVSCSLYAQHQLLDSCLRHGLIFNLRYLETSTVLFPSFLPHFPGTGIQHILITSLVSPYLQCTPRLQSLLNMTLCHLCISPIGHAARADGLAHFTSHFPKRSSDSHTCPWNMRWTQLTALHQKWLSLLCWQNY